MADDAPKFPGYALDTAALARAEKAQDVFRSAFADLAPSSLFDTEPQALEKTLNRRAGDASQ